MGWGESDDTIKEFLAQNGLEVPVVRSKEKKDLGAGSCCVATDVFVQFDIRSILK